MKEDVDTRSHHARLFTAHQDDRDLDISELSGLRPEQDELLWVDLQDPDAYTLDEVFESLGVEEETRRSLRDPATNPTTGKGGEQFWVRVVAVSVGDGLKMEGCLLQVAAGKDWVLTLHRDPIDFINRVRRREPVGSDIGRLRAESFVAALLDWHLSTYFGAAADFEVAIERLEVSILDDKTRECLPEMRRLRKAASRLRRMLSPHRAVFGALSRPDFSPASDKLVDRHFAALDTRFERAMDMVENARDLVIGSFELLSSQTALKTNNSMRTLTFATVITGILAVIAGVLGMNFDAPFFKTQTTGFVVAAGAMLALAGAALWLGRRRAWY